MNLKAVFVMMLAVDTMSEPTLRARCHEDEPDRAIFMDYITCVNNFIDVGTVSIEIHEAETVDSFKLLFKKYCPKLPQIKTCIRDFFIEMGSCQGQSYQNFMSELYNSGDKAIDFICDNDGEKAASLIVEGGYQCVERKNNVMKECLNTAMNGMSSLAELKNSPTKEQCTLVDELRRCIVLALEDCPTRTAATMTESLFSFVTREMNCTISGSAVRH